MTANQEVFISVDIEASGPVPPDFSMLSIGAVTVVGSAEFYRELRPISNLFDERALEVTGFDLAVLRETGTAPEQAMADFAEWVSQVCGADGKPIFVGFNAPFDWAFVNYYFHHFLGRNPFGIGAVDVKALYMGATGCSWDDTRSSRFPVTKQNARQKHNALADARYQAQLFNFVRGLRGPSL